MKAINNQFVAQEANHPKFRAAIPFLALTLFFMSIQVAATPLSEDQFLSLLNQSQNWTSVFNDKFEDDSINSKIWNITQNDSTGGFNNALQAYNGNKTGNIRIDDGKLTITAKPQWYVQPIGCKNVCRALDVPNQNRAARPYTSGALNTYGKVAINFGKPGLIEYQFKSSGGAGTWPTLWMYTMNETYGGWSASGEIDIMEMWHSPLTNTAFGALSNFPQAAMWFGGNFPDNALLLANPTNSDLTGTQWHTVQFSWDGAGLFVWKLDGIVNFIVGPSDYKVRFDSSLSAPLVVNPYGSYISIVGNPVVSNQPYQGVYVGYDSNGGFNLGGDLITTNPSPAPFDSTNPYFLMLELQVGGNPFTNLAPENGDVFNAGNSVDLSSTPDGLLSDQAAQQLGLPQRPNSYFTANQKMSVKYIKYLVLKSGKYTF